MEALTVFHGVKLALEKRLIHLLIETDRLELFNLLTYNDFQNLIDDCRSLLKKASDPPYKHIFREVNRVVDQLAKNRSISLNVFRSLLTYNPPSPRYLCF